jgi:hypothetical protein
MSVAAIEAAALRKHLKEAGGNLQGFAMKFFKSAAKAIQNPWMVSVGEDFRFAGVQGSKPAGTKWINRYLSQLHRSTLHDRDTTRAFFQVMMMTHSPKTLFQPKILFKVFKSCFPKQAALTKSNLL